MKKLICTIAAAAIVCGAVAQNATSYFMEGSVFRSQFNPAFAPLRGYVNIPVLGGVTVDVTGNMSLDKILFPINGRLVTLFDKSVTAEQALANLSPRNMFGSTVRTNLIGFGAFSGCNHLNFWSVDINARVDADAQLPYEFFEFMKRGNNTVISDASVFADAFLEAAFNYSMPVSPKVLIGFRAKFLVGVSRAKMNIDRMDISLNENSWTAIANGNIDIISSGIDIPTQLTDDGKEIYKLNDISFKPKSLAPVGYGFAVDLGVTYDPVPNLQLSLAANDIGFIAWGKEHAHNGTMSKEIVFDGVVIDKDGADNKGFDIGDIQFEKQESQGITKMLKATINAGVEYDVWRHKLGFGLFYQARIREYNTLHNVTASVNFHPVRWFTLSSSYSFIDNYARSVGFALNLCPNWINFFIATDILTANHTPQFLPIKQNSMNVTLGIGVPIGPRSHRIPAYIRDTDKR